jgi:hypothetical protein
MTRLKFLVVIVALLHAAKAFAIDYNFVGVGGSAPGYPAPLIFGPTIVPEFAKTVDYNNAFVNLSQYNVLSATNSFAGMTSGTVIVSGNLKANDFIANSPAFISLQQRINTSFQQLQQDVTQSFRGTAAVAAMANISMPSAPGRTTWAINGAAFQSEFGGGVSLAHRLNLSMPVAVTAAYGNGGGTAHVGRVGLMGEF